jgi:hypothetical protein
MNNVPDRLAANITVVTTNQLLEVIHNLVQSSKEIMLDHQNFKSEVLQKVSRLETQLEKHVRLAPWQAIEMKNAVAMRVKFHLPSESMYIEHKNKVTRTLWNDLKKAFLVPQYREIPLIRYEDAMEFIRTWYPQLQPVPK